MNPSDEAELSRFQANRAAYIAKAKEADKNAKGQDR